MDVEMLARIMESKKYQKMAICALFPERGQQHLEVIEKEIKAMFMEEITDCVLKYTEAKTWEASSMHCQSKEKETNSETTSKNIKKQEKVQKVSIQ